MIEMAAIVILEKNISEINEVLERDDQTDAKEQVDRLIAVFPDELKGTTRHLTRNHFVGMVSDFKGNTYTPPDRTNHIKDLKIIRDRLESELEKAKEKLKMTENTNINIFGNASGNQIQVGVSNSSQTQKVDTGVDFEQVVGVIEEILACEASFPTTYGDDAKKISEAIKEAKDAAEKRDEGKLKKALSVVKDIAVKAASSIIATGVVSALKKLPFLGL